MPASLADRRETKFRAGSELLLIPTRADPDFSQGRTPRRVGTKSCVDFKRLLVRMNCGRDAG